MNIMKSIVSKRLHLFLLSIYCLLSFLTAPAATVSLRIMTYNVPKKIGGVDATGVNTWQERRDSLRVFLRQTAPDLLGMQEPVRDVLMDLLAGWSGYSMIGVARDNGAESGEYSNIIYNRNRFLVEDYGTYWLSLTPDKPSSNWNSQCRRIATWAIFRDKATQARFLYTNTHLDHISDEARTHQMEVLKSHMQATMDQYGAMPAMVTGDFNVSTTESGAYTQAAQYLIPMNDAWLIAPAREGTGLTFSSWNPNRKLDYIMLTRDIHVRKAYIASSALSNGTYRSDHNPHYADIYWTTSPQEDQLALLERNLLLQDSAHTYVSTSEKLLLHTASSDPLCQISYDAAEPGIESETAHLTDGNKDTYFHSLWSSNPPEQPHYLQIDFQRSDVSRFRFTYCRRNSDVYGIADRWQGIRISASHDGNTWQHITDIENFGGDALQEYESQGISLHRPYRHVRLSIMQTPAMKIRNSNPQFTCSELQLYLNKEDTLQSPYYTDDVTARLTDSLSLLTGQFRPLLLAGTQIDSASWQLYRQTASRLRWRLNLKTLLGETVSLSKKRLDSHSIGTGFGQTDSASYQMLKSVYTKVRIAWATGRYTLDECDSLITLLKSTLRQFESSLVTYRLGTWYYILSADAASSGTYRLLMAQGNGSGAPLCWKTVATQVPPVESNAYGMWRLLAAGAGDSVLLQNRATGLCLTFSGESVSMGPTGSPVTASLTATDRFSLQSTRLPSYSLAIQDHQAVLLPSSLPTWTFREVPDARIQTMTLPVAAQEVSIMTFPWPFTVNAADSSRLHTYTLVGMPALTTLYLQEKSSFEAGEPMIMVTRSTDVSDTLLLHVAPPADVTASALTVNGMHGVLDHTKLVSTVCTISNGIPTIGTGTIPANTGYIVRKEVQTLGTPDATLTRSGLTGIPSPSVSSPPHQPVTVYTLDGQEVAAGITLQEAMRTLGSGIYVIGRQKVRISRR